MPWPLEAWARRTGLTLSSDLRLSSLGSQWRLLASHHLDFESLGRAWETFPLIPLISPAEHTRSS